MSSRFGAVSRFGVVEAEQKFNELGHEIYLYTTDRKNARCFAEIHFIFVYFCLMFIALSHG